MIYLVLVFLQEEGVDQKFIHPDSLDILARHKVELAPEGRTFTGAIPLSLNSEFLGPMPIHGEGWSDGIVSGRVSYILPHPSDADIIYIAAAGGGVWKTEDGGSTWIPLTDGLPTTYSGALAFDPTNPDIIYYGTGELHYCGDCFPGDGLFRSTDGGSTWTKIATTSEVGSYISRILINPGNPDIIFVAGNEGLTRSTDGGNSWQRVFYSDVNSVVVNPQHPDTMFLGAYGLGVYVSVDGGSSWTRINSLPTSGDGIGRVELAIHPRNPSYLLASFVNVNTSGLYGLYRSNDGGATWTRLPAPDYLRPQGWYDHAIIFHPFDTSIIFAGGVYPYDTTMHGIVRSLDGGYTWEDVTRRDPNGRVHPDIHFFAWGADTALYVASDGGVWRSRDLGDSWENLNENLGITQFYTLDIKPDYEGLVLGGTQDNGTVLYYDVWGHDWQCVRTGDGGPVLWLRNAPDTFLTTYVNLSHLVRYLWTGNNFQYDRYIGTPWGQDPACWACGPLESEPLGVRSIVYAGTNRVYRSRDNGITWEPISDPLTSGYNFIISLAMSRLSDTIYAGTSRGEFIVSFDGGETWIYRTLPDVTGWQDVMDIWMDPGNSARVYVAINNPYGAKVVYSDDAGESWVDISGNLNLAPYALAVDFRSDTDIVFVGTLYGLYYSVDGGGTYQKLESVPAVPVMDIELDTLTSSLVLATHGRGMWKVDVSSLVPLPEGPYIIRGRVDADYGGAWEPGETMHFDVQLVNTGNEMAYSVEGFIHTSNTEVMTLDSNSTWGNIGPGQRVYSTDGGFTVRAGDSLAPGTMVTFDLIVSYLDGAATHMIDTLEIVFFVDREAYPVYSVDAGEFIVTVSRNGAFPSPSYAGSAPDTGAAFRFMGVDQLFYGSFAVGFSRDYVADMWYDGTNPQDRDFIFQDGIFVLNPPGFANFMVYNTMYDTSGLVVEQSAMTLPGIPNAVVLRYRITNGTPLNRSGLYAGVLLDLDVGGGSGYNQNVGHVSNFRHLAYLNYQNVYAGAMFAGTPDGSIPASGLSIIPNSVYVYGQTPDSIKYMFMSGELFHDGSSPADYSIVVSAGPFDLSSGASDTVELYFAFLADTSIEDLIRISDSIRILLPVGYDERMAQEGPSFRIRYSGKNILELNISSMESARIELFDVAGRRRAVIHRGMVYPGKNTFEIPDKLPVGVYILRMEISSRIYRKPIVIY